MANRLLDLSGQQFGCLQVIAYDESSKGNNDSYWKYKCVNCGHEGSARGNSIKKCPKSCVNCKMTYRTYDVVQVKCSGCDSNILSSSNHKSRYCSVACHLEAIARKVKSNRTRDINGLLTSIYTQAKNRAKRRAIEFNLPPNFIHELYIRQGGACARTSVTLLASDSPGKSRSHKHTASIDRVDTNKGYTVDNVELVSYICNSAKNAFTHEDLYEFCTQYIKTYEERGSSL